MLISDILGLRVCEAKVLTIELNEYWSKLAREQLPASEFACGYRMLLGVHLIDGQPIHNPEAKYSAHEGLAFVEIYGIAYGAYGDDGQITKVDLANRIRKGTELMLEVGQFVTFSGELYRKTLANGRLLSMPNGEPLFCVKRAHFVIETETPIADGESMPASTEPGTIEAAC